MRYVILAATLLCPLAARAASFERFDAPGATTTCGTALASNGLVAGIASRGAAAVGATAHAPITGGFLYRSGRFQPITPAVPPGLLTITGLNRFRAVTGVEIESGNLALENFVFDKGTTSFPTIPQGSVNNLAGITDSFTILGQTTITSGSLFPARFGFLKTAAGAVTLIDDGSGGVQPAGLSENASYVVGTSLNGNGAGWVFHNGGFTPIAYPGALFTLPHGVNTKGNVAGSYISGTQAAPVAHGFRLRNGVYSTWDVPTAQDTQITAMNETGQLTGCYTLHGRTHGYLYTP